MGQPIAKQGDQVVGIDTHIVLIPSPGGPVPTPMPFSFSGPLQDSLSQSVCADNMNVAVEGSSASAIPPHIPMGGPFQKPPASKAWPGCAQRRDVGDATCARDATDGVTGAPGASSRGCHGRVRSVESGQEAHHLYMGHAQRRRSRAQQMMALSHEGVAPFQEMSARAHERTSRSHELITLSHEPTAGRSNLSSFTQGRSTR
jgi:hypothetical protein